MMNILHLKNILILISFKIKQSKIFLQFKSILVIFQIRLVLFNKTTPYLVMT